MSRQRLFSLLAASFIALPASAPASDQNGAAKEDEESVPYEIIFNQSEFKPFELEVAPNKKLKITVRNEGLSPIEFESKQLNREKIVQPGNEVVLFIPPLKPGTYKYINDFNAEQKGFITAK